jgi:hydroxyacyl-ACP dehydratase HTD2-like protein with hotdog domain
MKIEELSVGQPLPSRQHTATNVSLFCYNAAVWNPHRIHYDQAYTTGVEKHPGIVIDGPLQGDWLSQVALNWLDESGTLTQFSYANRQAAYLGETLTSGGTITAINQQARRVELELFILNEQQELITPGHGIVLLTA